MPNCFSLTRKSDLEAGAVKLQTIDAEVCAFMQEPVDQEDWCYAWYDVIGFKIAMGGTWETIRADLEETKTRFIAEGDKGAEEFQDKVIVILGFLESNFTYDAWAEIGRR